MRPRTTKCTKRKWSWNDRITIFSNNDGIEIRQLCDRCYPTVAEAEQIILDLKRAVLDQNARTEALKNAQKRPAKARKASSGTSVGGNSTAVERRALGAVAVK